MDFLILLDINPNDIFRIKHKVSNAFPHGIQIDHRAFLAA